MAPPEALVFRPTLAEVESMTFEQYVERIEPQLMRVGICKIVAPAGWTPRAAGYEGVDYVVPRPVRQMATGARGLFRTCLIEEKAMRVAGHGGFAERASAPEAQAPGGPDADVDSLEREFWKKVTYSPPLYGADVEGSLFDPACAHWSVGRLETLLSRTLRSAGARIPGVTSPYLYFGAWRALFAWHTEDLDLYSVNYLHFGAPKTWYCVPPDARGRLERCAASAAPELFTQCREFLRHKELLLSPALLRAAGVPFTRVTQRAREFVITSPGAYHAGFNHGFNCAESTNFATAAWVPFGAAAAACDCSGDAVRIDMRLFGVEAPPAKRGRRRASASSSSDDDDDAERPPKRAPRRPQARAVDAAALPPPPPPLEPPPQSPPLLPSAFYGARLLGPLGASAAAALPFVWKLAGAVVARSPDAAAAAAAQQQQPPAAPSPRGEGDAAAAAGAG